MLNMKRDLISFVYLLDSHIKSGEVVNQYCISPSMELSTKLHLQDNSLVYFKHR